MEALALIGDIIPAIVVEKCHCCLLDLSLECLLDTPLAESLALVNVSQFFKVDMYYSRVWQSGVISPNGKVDLVVDERRELIQLVSQRGREILACVYQLLEVTAIADCVCDLKEFGI